MTKTKRLFKCVVNSVQSKHLQQILRVWSVLGDFLKARVNKVSKIIRPEERK